MTHQDRHDVVMSGGGDYSKTTAPDTHEYSGPCERCDGTGRIQASWAMVKTELEKIMALYEQGDRFCRMLEIYRDWKNNGHTLPCWRCGG